MGEGARVPSPYAATPIVFFFVLGYKSFARLNSLLYEPEKNNNKNKNTEKTASYAG